MGTMDRTGKLACAEVRAALSAQADGEDPLMDTAAVDAHRATCPACRDFEAQMSSTRRSARLAVAPEMPDLSATVAAANARADRRSWNPARLLLGLVALEILLLSVPDLLAQDDRLAAAHATRHLGAFTLAYAVGLLVVVARPSRARAFLPVAAILAGALAITAVIDVSQGHVPLLGEATHLPEIVSVGLIWWLARQPRGV
jgi:predicted anti-sigma-YlaC factor YlaD